MEKDILQVMVLENEKETEQLYRNLLKQTSFTIHMHSIGSYDALLGFISKAGAFRPDLIFMNYAFTTERIHLMQQMRHHYRFQDFTFAVYSTEDTAGQMEDALIHGANIFFIKPPKASILLRLINDICLISWQYKTAGFKRDIFLMNIPHKKYIQPEKPELINN
jgi:PleD family two-component response regulator